jgi:hypothetical protein
MTRISAAFGEWFHKRIGANTEDYKLLRISDRGSITWQNLLKLLTDLTGVNNRCIAK